MMAASSEQCGHQVCDVGIRPEYCYEFAAQADGPAVTLAEVIDELLIDDDVRADKMIAQIDADTKLFTHNRLFQYQEHPQDGLGRLPVRWLVEVSYIAQRQPRRDDYRVRASWTVPNQLHGLVASETTYGFDVYPNGKSQSMYEQVMSLEGIDPEERQMTEYDYEQLFALVGQLVASRTTSAN